MPSERCPAPDVRAQVWVLVSRFLRWKRRNIAQSMSQLGLGLFSGLLMGERIP